MSTSTQLNISGSPERTFSYADAAKKSEQSRENSPGSVVQQSSPSTKSSSPVSPLLASAEPSTTSVPSRIEASVSSGATDGISFFYDDSEAITTPSEPENIETVQATDGNAFVLNLCGKTVRFVKGMAPSGDMQPANSRHLCMVEMLANRWKLFQEGHVPKVYQPKMMAS
uniref:Uncharacterized protein n=1 Tax=Heterorhabditis bacteriophora TaxID=37862 RepID=A0A1I7XRC1_HETBA